MIWTLYSTGLVYLYDKNIIILDHICSTQQHFHTYITLDTQHNTKSNYIHNLQSYTETQNLHTDTQNFHTCAIGSFRKNKIAKNLFYYCFYISIYCNLLLNSDKIVLFLNICILCSRINEDKIYLYIYITHPVTNYFLNNE